MLSSRPLDTDHGISRCYRVWSLLCSGRLAIGRSCDAQDPVRQCLRALVLLPVLATCLPAASLRATQDSVYHDTHAAMGTRVEIFLQAPSAAQAAELFAAGFAEIDYVDATLSGYKANSEVSRINGTAARGAVTIDPELFGLFERAADYGRITNGAFDITVGPLAKAWGFYGGVGQRPSRRALARARARSGWGVLELDSVGRTVRFRREGAELDFGAIGKGWALDRAASVLRRLGIEAALLGAGRSSYYAIGAPPGRRGWTVHVRDPADTTSVLATVLLRDGALATSGATQRFFESDGHRYSHIIDPRTGSPVEGMLQVTVTASTATDSDALSTALFVLGPDEVAGLLDAPHRGALFVRDADHGPRIVAVNWLEGR
jgi:thiamine biosynthesis lipoprotein